MPSVLSSHLVYFLGSHVVWCEPEDLGEVAECSVYVVLVVETKAPHVDGVGVHVVDLENGVGSFRGLSVPAKEGETLGPGRLETGGVVGNLQRLVQAPERLPVVPCLVSLLAVSHHPVNHLHVPLLGAVLLSQAGQLGQGLLGGDSVAEHDTAPCNTTPALGELRVEAGGRPRVLQRLARLAQHEVTC